MEEATAADSNANQDHSKSNTLIATQEEQTSYKKVGRPLNSFKIFPKDIDLDPKSKLKLKK